LWGVALAPLGIIGFLDDGSSLPATRISHIHPEPGIGDGGKGIAITQAIYDIDRKSLDAICPLIDATLLPKLNLGLN